MTSELCVLVKPPAGEPQTGCRCLLFLFGVRSERLERDSRWPCGCHRCLGCVKLCSCAPASSMLAPVFAGLAACSLSQIYVCWSFSVFPDLMSLMISSPVVSAGWASENICAVEDLFLFVFLSTSVLMTTLFIFDSIFLAFSPGHYYHRRNLCKEYLHGVCCCSSFRASLLAFAVLL